MNRLDKIFSKKNKNVLNIYCTAGFPQLNSTIDVLQALQDNGADIIELGMPYSDPLADGEVIQGSSSTALQNGMSIHILMQQLKNVRDKIDTPIILMGYLNPVLQFGIEQFCSKAKEVGIDGVILPDLPIHEFETIYKPLFDKNNLKFIFLVTPETSEKRIKKIDSLSSGFLYAVSSSSTTGKNKAIENQEPYFKKLQEMRLKNPILVGFGIKDKHTFSIACKYTNGAIIGTAFVKALESAKDITIVTKKFLKGILD